MEVAIAAGLPGAPVVVSLVAEARVLVANVVAWTEATWGDKEVEVGMVAALVDLVGVMEAVVMAPEQLRA